jgi:exodeoxyribonuclease VII small subunit
MSNPTETASEQPTFESALARIECIVHELEEGQTGLAESLACYEEAVRLLKQCYGVLEKAERKIELLVGIDAAGNIVTEPFDDTATAERAESQVAPKPRRSASPAKSSDAAPVRSLDAKVDSPQGLF